VRAHPQAAHTPWLPERADTIRVLLVISRPGPIDIPFQSVAARLVTMAAPDGPLRLDVLRPPTFAALQRTLSRARNRGMPYHVVHIDGHGTYLDVGHGNESSLLSPRRPGEHGYLLFEEPNTAGRVQLVDGPALGRLLADSGTPVLVLNACRSAHAEVRPTRSPTGGGLHAQVRAYGTLAQEIMDVGVAGVVAMRYNVYADTAARFVGEVYAGLLGGLDLGTAATRGRQHLAADPLRDVGGGELAPLQDWCVPVVYEAAPLTLLDPPPGHPTGVLDRARGRTVGASRSPSRSDEDALLDLERAFLGHSIVLLQGDPASGASQLAAEFAHWYTITGGVDGPVLRTSLAERGSVAAMLDDLAEALAQRLDAQQISWPATPQAGRMSIVTHLLARAALLWIWDDLAAAATWPAPEQQALVRLLQAARDGPAKILLLSNSAEQALLGELPVRLTLPARRLRSSGGSCPGYE
jgi:CHAT domain